MVTFMAQSGVADVNMSTPYDGMTALMFASYSNYDQREIVRMLIERGADVNIKNSKGMTALMIASRGGRTEIVRMLIERGADVNIKNSNGKTALMLAKPGSTVAPIIINQKKKIKKKNFLMEKT